MHDKPIQPNRWYYGLGALIFFTGTALTALIIITQFHRYLDEPMQIPAPGHATIAFERTGPYTVYYEYLSEYDGRRFDTGKAFIDLDAELRSTDTAEPVYLSRARITFNRYIFGPHRDAIALLNFRVDTKGEYEFIVSLPNDHEDADLVLSVAPDYIRIALVTIGWSIPLFFLTIMASIIAVLITYFKRRETIQLREYEKKILPSARTILKLPQPWN
jgi:hypothetical protein